MHVYTNGQEKCWDESYEKDWDEPRQQSDKERLQVGFQRSLSVFYTEEECYTDYIKKYRTLLFDQYYQVYLLHFSMKLSLIQ